MIIQLSDNRHRELEAVIRRAGLEVSDHHKEKLLQWMLLRQCAICLERPKHYIDDLFHSKRIVDSDANIEIEIQIAITEKVRKELEKARGRWGSGVDKIAEPRVTEETLFVKMISEELNQLYKKKAGFHRYRRVQFQELRELIQDIEKTCIIPPRLQQKMNESKLSREHMIYYFLLSVNLPNTLDDKKAMAPSFVREIVNIKLKAMEMYIKNEEEAIRKRDGYDLIGQCHNADILAYRIRKYIEGSADGDIGDFSEGDLRKEVRQYFSDNG